MTWLTFDLIVISSFPTMKIFQSFISWIKFNLIYHYLEFILIALLYSLFILFRLNSFGVRFFLEYLNLFRNSNDFSYLIILLTCLTFLVFSSSLLFSSFFISSSSFVICSIIQISYLLWIKLLKWFAACITNFIWVTWLSLSFFVVLLIW